jgi:enamidase
MKILSILKWSLIGLTLLAGAGLIYGYARVRYPGEALGGPPIALVGGRVYDPLGDSVIEGATVVIEGREIVSVDAFAPVPDAARILYVNGLTLLPGYIDSHVHLSGIRSRVSDGSRELGWTGYLWKFLGRFPDRRRALIESGVTTVKSLGDPYPWIVRMADRIERHELAGPRIFAAGPMLTAPGGHPVARFRQAGQGDTSFIAQVTRQLVGPAEAGSAVKQISLRVDFITAVLETGGDTNLPKLSAGLLRTITTTAHDRGLPVLVHVSTLAGLDEAMRVGVDGIEHIPVDRPIDPIKLEDLRGRGLFVDPTLQAVERQYGELHGDTAAARRARQNVRRLHDAGVPLVAGSDAPSPGTTFGLTFHEELRNLVEVGLTPGEAIAAATSVAADYLGLSEKLGTIAPGKWADIVAVGGDPLADIVAAADIYLVIADGQVLFERLDDVRRAGEVIAVRPVKPRNPRGARP